jgi:hypothetical protein
MDSEGTIYESKEIFRRIVRELGFWFVTMTTIAGQEILKESPFTFTTLNNTIK